MAILHHTCSASSLDFGFGMTSTSVLGGVNQAIAAAAALRARALEGFIIMQYTWVFRFMCSYSGLRANYVGIPMEAN